ncbi:hypothetical protein WR25_07470 [Diploscapter pachys]|uniref:STAS domain-containing protein n=1 Tax=Diploscapter pachys TaxID=2018661 RepID=A0A2A2LRT4_9BILA|nr:hypothetical protein WR25_07470 [Diploscapter pachys]
MSQEKYDEKYGIDEEENHAFVDKFKRNLLVGDIVGGITTGIIHIPQGSFAVLSLMAKDAGEKIMENFRSDSLPPPTPIETATMLTFCMGIWQLLCGIFRLQFIVSYFSDPLISAFTTGAGCHVLVAQFDNLIGVTTHNSSSFFYIFERVLRIPSQIEHVNVYTCIISVLSIVFLEIGKEFYALGLTSMLSALFPLYPMSTGVGRTIASIKVGTNTQLSSLFSSSLLFLVILKIGSYLEQLPKCVLSAIIVTALLSLFKKKDELKRLYIVSKIDFIIWILSFVSTVCIGVIEGLVISICAGLLSIVLRTQWPRYGSFTYPTSHKSELTSSICVFRFDGPLLFTNCDRFIKSFERTFSEWMRTLDLEKSERPVFFIMDCSSISHIDFMGIKALENIAKELKTSGVSLYLVGTNSKMIA